MVDQMSKGGQLTKVINPLQVGPCIQNPQQTIEEVENIQRN
jgi:hypothetical protein